MKLPMPTAPHAKINAKKNALMPCNKLIAYTNNAKSIYYQSDETDDEDDESLEELDHDEDESLKLELKLELADDRLSLSSKPHEELDFEGVSTLGKSAGFDPPLKCGSL